MTYTIGALIVVGLIQAGMVWWLARGLRRLDGLDARLAHLTEAIRLLTETTETGFRASALEIARVVEEVTPRTAPPAKKAATRPKSGRTAPAAARRGRNGKPVIDAEDMSELESRLRLHMAEHAVAQATGHGPAARAALRA